MKILIVSQYYYPEQFQINDIAPALVRRGHQVTVLCGLPNYPAGKIYDGYNDLSKREELIDGVKIIRVKQRPRGRNPFSLILNYWSFVKSANRRINHLDNDFDVVLGYQLSPITSMLPAIKYSKIHQTPLLLYVLDLWPVSGFSHLPFRKTPVHKWLANLSKRIYSSSKRILVTSKPFIDYLRCTNDIALDKMGYLPQHADTTMLDMDLSGNTDNEVTHFMYAGNMGAGQTLEVIVKASRKLGVRTDYMIHFVGDGSCRQSLEKLVDDYNLNSVFKFHGNQSRADMPKYYRMADALLITLRGNNEVGNTMPGKLQMYMTTGKPIFGAINGAAKEVIEESKCGRCVNAGDSDGLAEIMRDYIDNKNQYSACGENAKEYFMMNFTLERFIDRLESELNQLSHQ